MGRYLFLVQAEIFWARLSRLNQKISGQVLDNFWQTDEILVKIEILIKMEILAKNQNLGQKWKFWSKIESFLKHQDLDQKSKLWEKLKFRSLIKISINSFGLRSKTFSKIKLSVKKSTIFSILFPKLHHDLFSQNISMKAKLFSEKRSK